MRTTRGGAGDKPRRPHVRAAARHRSEVRGGRHEGLGLRDERGAQELRRRYVEGPRLGADREVHRLREDFVMESWRGGFDALGPRE